MAWKYHAVVHIDREDNNAHNVTFPDLPGCVTFGHSLKEAKEMAQEAAELYVDVLLAEGRQPPKAQRISMKRRKESLEADDVFTVTVEVAK